MTLKLNGTNSEAAPGYAGDDADTGLQCGTNELKLVTGGSARATVDSSGNFGIAISSPDGKLTLPATASNTPALRLQSASSDTDGALSSYADATGTYIALGANYHLNSSGNGAVFDTNDKSAAILLDGRGSGSLQFLTGSTGVASERARLDSSGRLYLGTTNSLTQAAHLIVAAPGVATAEFYNAGGCYNTWSSGGTATARGFVGVSNQLVTGGSGTDFAVRAQSNLIFATGGSTERMRVSSSGAFMVGQTNGSAGTPGVVCNANGTLTVCTSNSTTSIFNHNDASGTRNLILFRTDGTNRGSITSNGSSTAYNTTSDYRLKENVVDIADGITRVKQLQPRRFNFIVDADTTVDGFVAHEAQAVVPEAVTGTHNGLEVWEEGEELPDGVSVGDNKLDDDGNTIPNYQGIDQSKLVPLLTAALQEAIAKIETLETKVAALEAAS